MVKRVDQNDSTMEVSASQLVPNPPRAPAIAPAGRRSAPPNDASMWMQSVVRSDEFAPTAPKPRTKVRGLVVFGVLAAAALIGGGIALWRSQTKPKPPAASVAAPEAPPARAAAPVPAIVDAAVEAAAPAVDATAPTAPAVDAVSGGGTVAKPATAAPAIKKSVRPSKKRPPLKKATTKRPTR